MPGIAAHEQAHLGTRCMSSPLGLPHPPRTLCGRLGAGAQRRRLAGIIKCRDLGGGCRRRGQLLGDSWCGGRSGRGRWCTDRDCLPRHQGGHVRNGRGAGAGAGGWLSGGARRRLGLCNGGGVGAGAGGWLCNRAWRRLGLCSGAGAGAKRLGSRAGAGGRLGGWRGRRRRSQAACLEAAARIGANSTYQR